MEGGESASTGTTEMEMRRAVDTLQINSGLDSPEDYDKDLEDELLLPKHLRRYGSSIEVMKKHKHAPVSYNPFETGHKWHLDQAVTVFALFLCPTIRGEELTRPRALSERTPGGGALAHGIFELGKVSLHFALLDYFAVQLLELLCTEELLCCTASGIGVSMNTQKRKAGFPPCPRR